MPHTTHAVCCTLCGTRDVCALRLLLRFLRFLLLNRTHERGKTFQVHTVLRHENRLPGVLLFQKRLSQLVLLG